MAKSHNQKAKILYLEQMLHGTGENRVVTMQEILTKLMEYGIRAERKSIYDDIEALRDFGMDVRFKRGRPGGYYLAGQSVAPLQEESTEPAHEYPSGTAEKSEMPEAMAEKTSENSSGENPISERTGIEGEDKPKQTVPEWQFVREIPSQDKKTMKLLCYNAKEQQVRAYFGDSAEYKKKGLGYLTVTTPLLSGPEFYGWLTAMGKDVHIVKPKKAAAAYRDYLKALAKEYKGI